MLTRSEALAEREKDWETGVGLSHLYALAALLALYTGSLSLKLFETDSTYTLGSLLTRFVPDSDLKGGNLLISILIVLIRNQYLVYEPRYAVCLF